MQTRRSGFHIESRSEESENRRLRALSASELLTMLVWFYMM